MDMDDTNPRNSGPIQRSENITITPAQPTPQTTTGQLRVADVLRFLRERRNLTRTDLATKADIDLNTLARIESGAYDSGRPRVHIHLWEPLVRALALSPQEQILFQAAVARAEGRDGAHDYLDAQADLIWDTLNPTQSDYYSRMDSPGDVRVDADRNAERLGVQLQDLEQSVATVSKRLDEMRDTATITADSTLAEQLQVLREDMRHMQQTSQALTAPVRIPSPSEMEVRLVPLHHLDRLEEYRNDESQWLTLFGITVGAIIAIVVNGVTGGKIEGETWILLGLLIVIALILGGATRQARQRGNATKQQMLSRTSGIGASERES